MKFKSNYTESDAKRLTEICKDLVTRKKIALGAYWFQGVMSFVALNQLRVNAIWNGVNYDVELV